MDEITKNQLGLFELNQTEADGIAEMIASNAIASGSVLETAWKLKVLIHIYERLMGKEKDQGLLKPVIIEEIRQLLDGKKTISIGKADFTLSTVSNLDMRDISNRRSENLAKIEILKEENKVIEEISKALDGEILHEKYGLIKPPLLSGQSERLTIKLHRL